MAQIPINYVAVAVAAVASIVIGALWYSPFLFGKLWMKLSGLSAKQLAQQKKKGMTQSYVLQFVASAVMAFVLAHFIVYGGVKTLMNAAQAAFWVWLGFIATTSLAAVLWCGKPWKLYLLDNAEMLISLIVMAGIIALWV